MIGDLPLRSFFSILYREASDAADEVHAPPDWLRDLNLDQIVDAVVASSKEYDLAAYFWTRLGDIDAIAWRHEVFRDLERSDAMVAVRAFATGMRSVRGRLAQTDKAHYRYEKKRLFLGAAVIYRKTIDKFAQQLQEIVLDSRGMRAFRAYLVAHAASAAFRTRAAEAEAVETGLAAVRYGILIDGATVTVRPYGGEIDYTEEVEATFEKFRRGAVEDFRVRFPAFTGINHIEAQIQDRVALLDPEPFRALESFCTKHAGFVDDTVMRFDREVQFYVAWLDYLAPLAQTGLRWCYPVVSRATHEVAARETFDLALAHKLVAAGSPVVCNDFALSGDERVFVVSGPNNGGKTTFARTFGQLHHLASVGCPVPGSLARLHHFDRIFVHFERQEEIANLRGKLLDELVRIRSILERITTDSIVIMNEIFASTTLKDAVLLGRGVLERISARDALGVCVTFLDELATVDAKMVSMTSMVDPRDPAIRSFRIVRRPPGGLAHALAIARKHRVDYISLKERLRR